MFGPLEWPSRCGEEEALAYFVWTVQHRKEVSHHAHVVYIYSTLQIRIQ